MSLYQHTGRLIKQFLQNMSEEDWASRHIDDRGPDVPTPVQSSDPDEHISSLSVALRQMGLVRQNGESSGIELDTAA